MSSSLCCAAGANRIKRGLPCAKLNDLSSDRNASPFQKYADPPVPLKLGIGVT